MMVVLVSVLMTIMQYPQSSKYTLHVTTAEGFIQVVPCMGAPMTGTRSPDKLDIAVLPGQLD